MIPVRQFIEPIRKKWVYHFIVSPKTSLIEKPEWYLNQTLKWIHDHIDTVESKSGPKESDKAEARHLFILCMLELVQMRLNKDLRRISDRIDEDHHYEAILIHTYNEVIIFTKIIRQLLCDRYNDLEDQHDIMSEFAEQKLFEKIMDVEWEYSKKNLKEITAHDSKWDPVLEGDYVDYYKIPRCVDRFLLQIKSITERVECFLQLDCQFQLIDLQCSLLNKFLTFMKQSTEPSTVSKSIISDFLLLSDESTIDLSRILRVLNGVNFLRLILKERCFIPTRVLDNLDKTLQERLNKVTQDYKIYFNKLIDKVVNVYGYVDCDLQKFLNFIKPKLANNIYETIRDEAAKVHESHQSQTLLRGLSLG